MTQEDKELLMKDLCARLPYKLVCEVKFREYGEYKTSNMFLDGVFNDDAYFFTKKEGSVYSNDYKPYLFPLSSMTEEQKQEYTYIVNYISPDDTDNWKEGEFIYVEQFIQLMHFYHINHLDYMGLIEKGLAIDATGLNIY